jgi:hypothetical protein
MANEDKPTVDAPQDGGTPTEDSQDQVDDAYKGKSLEEIIKMHKELKSHSDRQLETLKAEKDKEIAAKEKDLQAYQSWQQHQQQTQAAPQPTQTPQVDQSKLVDALLENPVETLNQILDYRDAQKTRQEAFSEGPMALAQAKRERPDLFEGVDDNQLQQIVFGGIQSGDLKPYVAKNPKAWMMAAYQTHGVASDFKLSTPPPTPPTPPTGDLPPGVKPQVGDKDENDVEFDPLTLEMAEAFGKTKTQATDMINKWRKNPDPRMSLTEKE